MLWCTELDTAENFGLTSIQKPLIAISKCPLLNIHPVWAIYVVCTKNAYHIFYYVISSLSMYLKHCN